MDLAKIRQKARRAEQGAAPAAGFTPEEPVLHPPLGEAPQPWPAASLTPDSREASGVGAGCFLMPPYQTVRRSASFDPVKAIMDGRAAAGCGDGPDSGEAAQAADAASVEKFLCVRVSDEVYGINIMRIKEIITRREVTEVPRAPSFVSGVISLRGVILPIIDMRKRLGLEDEGGTAKARIVVVTSGKELAGLMVDEVIQVVAIADAGLEPVPAVLDGIDRDFVSGIGRADNRMIILLNLGNIVDVALC